MITVYGGTVPRYLNLNLNEEIMTINMLLNAESHTKCHNPQKCRVVKDVAKYTSSTRYTYILISIRTVVLLPSRYQSLALLEDRIRGSAPPH